MPESAATRHETSDNAPGKRQQGHVEGWVASISGILGSAILASNTALSGWGWPLYLISSVTWCRISIATGNRPLLAMNAVFTLINLVAIWRWTPWN